MTVSLILGSLVSLYFLKESAWKFIPIGLGLCYLLSSFTRDPELWRGLLFTSIFLCFMYLIKGVIDFCIPCIVISLLAVWYQLSMYMVWPYGGETRLSLTVPIVLFLYMIFKKERYGNTLASTGMVVAPMWWLVYLMLSKWI